MIRSLLLSVLLGSTLAQLNNNQNLNPTNVQHVTRLVFRNKVLSCSIVNVVGFTTFGDEDCSIFMYINRERVATVTGLTLQYHYKQLLYREVSCSAMCENSYFKDHNITPSELEINKTIFIGLCAGAGAAFILLVIAIICGVKHCRGHYYRKVPEHGEPMDLEKQPPVPIASPTVQQPPSYKKSLEAELATEVRKKKVSESSEASSDEDNADGDLYNYNPNSKYNYAEMTSEI